MNLKALKVGVFLFVLVAVMLLVIVSPNYAQEGTGAPCNPGSDQSRCGEFISTSGHGAVELCSDCFVCGANDGVCPSRYSDGTITRRNITMKVPFVQGSTQQYTISYSTGNEACDVIAGDCDSVMRREQGGSWSAAGSCAQDISSSSEDQFYYKAVCDAPRTAGCIECPDPDCGTQLRGVTYSTVTGELMGDVRVRVYAPNNDNINTLTQSSPAGFYNSELDSDFNPVEGRILVSCIAPQYFPLVQEVVLQPGSNIFNCAMERADCTPSCTLPDADGEEVCRADCAGEGGCAYPSIDENGYVYSPEEIAGMCDGLRSDTFIPLGPDPNDDDYVVGIVCCNQGLESRFMPYFNLRGDDIKNLITRNYRKDLDGMPVTLKIIVYNR